jgi:hypothetical protein
MTNLCFRPGEAQARLLAIIQGDLMDFETVYNFGKSGCINF